MSAAKITALEALVTALTARVDALEKTLAASAPATNETKTSKTKEVKEKTPRGTTGWSLFFKHVSAEMKKANPDTKYKLGDFVAEAKKRKENGDYDEAHWKSEAAKINTAA